MGVYMDLSIVIVNYKTYHLTKQTIDSVISTVNDITYEIILIDNDSNDGSFEKLCQDFNDFSNILLIKNKNNDGFAVANNIGFKNANGNYILMLNSDVIVHKNTINKSLQFIKDHRNVGILGCKVVLPNGNLDKACRRSFPTVKVSFYRMIGLSKLFSSSPRFNQYNLSYLDDTGIYPVDSVVGAFMLINSEILKKCNGLDESYFMYGEDIDLCFKVKQLGYEVYYYGKYEITHFKGASGKNKRLLYEFHKSMEIFYNNHYKSENSYIINFITYVGIWGLYYVKLFLLLLSN